MTKVSVLIPTFRRPDSFVRAARSVFAQTAINDIELIAVDNSPEGSALRVFERIASEAPCPFHWTHAPTPGVSQARNAALMLARGDLIAWLDDDEEASPGWIAALVAVRRQTGAQAVFGPVHARAPKRTANAIFFERLYSRVGESQSGPIAHYYGMGNSLQPRRMFDGGAPFDTSADQRGGEDDILFSSWQDVGAHFAWAADAVVTEHLGPERTSLKHGLKRAFAYGQGPCETAWAQRNYAALTRHMAIGLGQALVFGFASAIVLAGSTPRALALLDRAVRGAGKLCWFVEQRFYGEALGSPQPA